ncbi:MAG: alpha/beta hydrolase [Lachnospiraceae bacterium]|nr:alpha/beta hydrolase [Lachnospiraceae bacterium]
MTYHEFGTDNKRVIILIHPAVVMWDYFEYVVPLLEKDFHLIIPALPGYDPDRKDDFTSVEVIAAEIEKWVKDKEIQKVECIYGCSMGGAIVAKLLSNNLIHFEHAVMDGGITPYQLPWLLTRFIALRDFIMISMGKLGGIKLLEKAFSTDELSEDDIRYEAKVLDMISYRTIWRTFDSANNYAMPKRVVSDCPHIEYWFADAEEKDRKWDIAYIRKAFPDSRFVRYRNAGHGGLAPFYPEKFAKGIRKLCNK